MLSDRLRKLEQLKCSSHIWTVAVRLTMELRQLIYEIMWRLLQWRTVGKEVGRSEDHDLLLNPLC